MQPTTYIDSQTLAVLIAVGNILFICGVAIGTHLAPAFLRARRLKRIRKRRLAAAPRFLLPILK